jgi:putative transcriptional regulator
MSDMSGSGQGRGRVNWAKLRSLTPDDINRIAAEERAALGMGPPTGKGYVVYNVPPPDVKRIRERLGLSQAAFAARFHLRERTVQQWEQGRAFPDQPARVLLRAIEQHPDIIAEAASAVEEDERAFAVSFLKKPE